MSTPIEGGRPLFKGRVLGFPVHLDISFVIVMALIGYASGLALRHLVLWLAITPFAVLVHELGHALTARSAGAAPRIALAGFGGVTTFAPPRALSRGRALWISSAGPLAGLAVGAVLLAARLALFDQLQGWTAVALDIGIWTCVAWSVLNLLPVLPLDGGQILRELLPGTPAVRARRAAAVSVVTAGLTAIAAYQLFGQLFVAIFMLFFAITNLLTLRQAREQADGDTPTPTQAVIALLWDGEPARARELLESLEPGAVDDLAVHGAVLALAGDPAQGHALLDQEVERRADDPDVAALLALTLTLERDWDRLAAVLEAPLGRFVPGVVTDRAVAEARAGGAEDVATRLRAAAGG